MRFVDWAFRDRRTGRLVIGQWPNLWLWIFIAASLVEVATGSSTPIGAAARLVAAIAIVVWAGDELLRGVNPWRRALGAAVLIGSAVQFLT